jgi:hypothetical protein
VLLVNCKIKFLFNKYLIFSIKRELFTNKKKFKYIA